MLALRTAHASRHCDGLSRRDWLRIGGLGACGLSLPNLLRAESTSRRASRAKSAIILFLSGGPSHLDMFDLKPDAPEDIRGTFRPTATRVPGMRISEHLPRMAHVADKYSIIRSMQHATGNHPTGAYLMMTGSALARPAPQAISMSREDRPHPGSALAKLLPNDSHVPPFVMVPEAISPVGPERPGQHAGFLGATYDPYRVNSDPSRPTFSPGALLPQRDVSTPRLGDRRSLLAQVSAHARHLEQSAVAQTVDPYYTRAFD